MAIHISDDFFLSYSSRDVQLLVACCIADVLRIYAPEAPYKDQGHVKVIIYFNSASSYYFLVLFHYISNKISNRLLHGNVIQLTYYLNIVNLVL